MIPEISLLATGCKDARKADLSELNDEWPPAVRMFVCTEVSATYTHRSAGVPFRVLFKVAYFFNQR
eukprot:COSAG02_NODE_63334_length_263_cov_0.939024_1_plen_65_part_10